MDQIIAVEQEKAVPYQGLSLAQRVPGSSLLLLYAIAQSYGTKTRSKSVPDLLPLKAHYQDRFSYQSIQLFECVLQDGLVQQRKQRFGPVDREGVGAGRSSGYEDHSLCWWVHTYSWPTSIKYGSGAFRGSL
jgi:hypothetical protein